MSLTTDLQKLVRKAKILQRTLGLRAAAGFMRNREISFEQAHLVLFGRMPRRFA